MMKKFSILALLMIVACSCSDNQSDSASGNVTIKASAVSSTGKTSLTARGTVASTVVITDFKINIGSIKLETDEDDIRYTEDPSHDEVKLKGPFLLDLLDPDKTLSPLIASVAIPNAKYEEIKFKFQQSVLPGEMNGRSFMIKGTVNGKNFVVWSAKEVELEMDFNDPEKDFMVNGNDISLNIKIQIDAIMAKIASLAGQGLLIDTDADGVIEITTDNDDNHHDLGEIIRDLLENESHLDDKD